MEIYQISMLKVVSSRSSCDTLLEAVLIVSFAKSSSVNIPSTLTDAI